MALTKCIATKQSVNAVAEIYHGCTNGNKSISCGTYEDIVAVCTAFADRSNKDTIDTLSLGASNGTISKIINGAKYDDGVRGVAKTFVYYIKKEGSSEITVTANCSGGMSIYELTILGIK